jgi:hypothetical protein
MSLEIRWIASFLIPPDQFGVFAFSANIFSLLVGAVGGISAFYYPKIVERIVGSGPYALSGVLTRDLCGLVGVVTCVMGVGVVLAGFLISCDLSAISRRHRNGADHSCRGASHGPGILVAAALIDRRQSPARGRVGDLSARERHIGRLYLFPLPTFWRCGRRLGSTISVLPLNAMQLLMLRHARILRTRDTLILFGVSLAACVILGLFAWRVSV